MHAIAFIGTAGTVPELARTVRGQLDRLAYFPDTVRRYQKASARRWESLDAWQQQITGPLTLYPHPVRLLIDGLDQLEGQPEHRNILRALTTLTTYSTRSLGHVSLVLTGRTTPLIPGIDQNVPYPPSMRTPPAGTCGPAISMPPAGDDSCDWPPGWLVLGLAADLAAQTGRVGPDSFDQLYTDLLDRLSTRHADSADAVLGVLAAGAGPVLPFDVLAGAVGRLGQPLARFRHPP